MFENSYAFSAILVTHTLVEGKAKNIYTGKVSHVCFSLLKSVFAHNQSNRSGSHWYLNGILALFLCSCRKQDVPSTLYHCKEISVHETRDQCVSAPREKT